MEELKWSWLRNEAPHQMKARMATAKQLIEYQRKCYEADNRETGIANLLHSKIRHLRFLDGMEVAVSGTLPRVALPKKYAEALQKDTFKYRRDKSLVYAAFPIVGDGSFDGRLPALVCAPLVYLPGVFAEAKGSLFFEPDIDRFSVNFSVLATIAEATGSNPAALVDFLASLAPMPWPRDRLHSLAAGLAEVLPGVDFTSLASFPDLANAKAVMARLPQRDEAEAAGDSPSSEPGTLTCLPAVAIALLPNSPETRGVLFELAQMIASPTHSRPMRTLLSGSAPAARPSAPVRWPTPPSVLSDGQRCALTASLHYPVSLIVGPPGTGKSHTIASIALEHLARNQSVLIASRMDQAVDVVGNKLETLIGSTHAIVRAGRKGHKRELIARLQDLLQGIAAKKTARDSETSARAIRRQLRTLTRTIEGLEGSLERQLKNEIAWGELDVVPGRGFIGGLTHALAKRLRTWQLGESDVWQKCENYESLLEQRCELSRVFFQKALTERVEHLLKRRLQDLTKFMQAIRARSDSKQQSLFDNINFSVLLHAFPVWLCKLTDLSNVLPLRRELFDVAILDEATQCDIASCLPLLHRAKRVVVVGDPKQLKHISFLPEARQQTLANDCELSEQQQELFHYRDKSILHAVSDSLKDRKQVAFLNEHFRSLPGIIRFSNTQFYSNALAVMRERPDTLRKSCVQIRRVDGQRGKNGRNETEAHLLVDDLVAHIDSQRDRKETADSIGVLSPFRDQVDFLAKALDRRLSYTQMEQHDLLIGTAHTFQGEERDVMFLSLAVDLKSHAASFRFLNNPNLLNVAITRARHLQLLYTSFDHNLLDKHSLLHKLLQDALVPPQTLATPNRSMDSFRLDVICRLEEQGFKSWKDYRVAGEAIDLIVEGKHGSVAIDLIGYPGQLAAAYSLERYRMIHRAGLPIFPLPYRDWKVRQALVLQRISNALQI